MSQSATPSERFPSLERHAEIYDEAIANRICFPEWLKNQLDGAAAGGVLPKVRDLVRFFDHENSQGADWDVDRCPFNGRAPTGEIIDFAECLPWTTARTHYGWGMPGEETILGLSKIAHAAGGLLEIGCGSGFWSAMLKFAAPSTQVIAVDNGLDRGDNWFKRPWTEIVFMDGREAIKIHPNLPILMSWPASGPLAHDIGQAMTSGRVLIVAGSPQVTASPEFWKSLDRDFDHIEDIPCVATTGGPDDARVFVKRFSPNRSPSDRFAKLGKPLAPPSFFRR